MIEFAALALGWLLTWLLHSTLLLGTAFVAERWGRIRSGALLASLWRAALFGAIATATLQMAFATSPLQGRVQIAAAQTIAMRVSAGHQHAVPQEQGAEQTALASVRSNSASPDLTAAPSIRVDRIALLSALAAWLLIAMMRLGRVGLGARTFRRDLASRRRLHSGAAFNTLAALCHETGLQRLPRLSVSASLRGPVSLPNGEICLPAWTLERLTPGQLRALLAHELAHCRRRDPLWQIAVTLANALLFLQPLNRLARLRLAAAVELACDDWAVERTGDRLALVECLAECAARLQSGRLTAYASAMAAPDSELAHRAARLTNGERLFNGEISMKTRIGIVTLLAAPALFAPGCSITPSSAQSSAPPPAVELAASAPVHSARIAAVALRQTMAESAQAAVATQQAVSANKRAAKARQAMRQGQAELARQQARLQAKAASMRKAAEAMRGQAEAMRKVIAKQLGAARAQAATAKKRATKATRQALRQMEAKMQRQRAQIKAQAASMRKAAQGLRSQAEAIRKMAAKQAKIAMRAQQKAMAEVKAQLEALEHRMQKAEAAKKVGR